MQKSEAILSSMEMVKSAFLGRILSNPSVQKVTGAIGSKWNKLPGVARYGIGLGATASFPTWMYLGGKSEAEDYVANKAYEDAYNLTQQRIGKEWENLPAWQRYAAATLGAGNSLAIKDWLAQSSEPGSLTYSTVNATGNKTYY